MKCELCEIDNVYNFHHFIPKTNHSNKWFKKQFTREQMREGVNVCKQCHKMIHEVCPSEKELGRKYNTKDKLLSHPKLKKYIKWKSS